METDVVDDVEMMITPEVLAAAVLEEYESAGLVKAGKDGDKVLDNDALKERTYQEVVSKVVQSRSEMSNKSKTLTQGELQAAVFPGSPGTDPKKPLSELTPLEAAVRAKLRRAVWNLTNPGRKGMIQSRLGKEGRTEVLVRTKVQRGVDEIVGVFITDDPDLIIQESVHPVIEKLLTAAREVRLYDESIIAGRHPELSPQVLKMLESAKKRVAAELNRPAPPALPALGAGAPAAEAAGE
jgi:hypothetical protein